MIQHVRAFAVDFTAAGHSFAGLAGAANDVFQARELFQGHGAPAVISAPSPNSNPSVNRVEAFT